MSESKMVQQFNAITHKIKLITEQNVSLQKKVIELQDNLKMITDKADDTILSLQNAQKELVRNHKEIQETLQKENNQLKARFESMLKRLESLNQ